MTITDAIPFFRTFGFNLVPLGGDKRPVQIGTLMRYHWQEWAKRGQSDEYWYKLPLSVNWWDKVQGLAAICGPVSGGLVCLDFDGLADGEHVADVAEALGLPRAYPWQVRSPGGGYHLWVRCPELELEKGKLRQAGVVATAVELRYTGHYVALPPSLHPSGKNYAWIGDALTDAPSAVTATALLHAYEAITLPPEPKTAYKPAVQAVGEILSNGNGGGEYVTAEYAQAALTRELDNLARAMPGGRNDALNTSSFALGQLVADGLLRESEVVDQLSAVATAIGLEDGEIAATLGSGLRAGMKKPRGLMLQPAYVNGNEHGPTPDINGDGTLLPVWTVEKPFELYNYKAEDGGVLDAWLAESGHDWIHVTGPEWLHWEKNHWAIGEDSKAISAEIQALMRTMNDLAEYKLEEAQNSKDKAGIEKAAAYLAATKRTSARVSSVEKMAQAQRSVKIDRLDGGGNLLNFANCTYDLNEYEARPHVQGDYITHVLPYEYDPEAICPRWEQFLREVLVYEETTDPDTELLLLFQEAVGYALTSEVQHEAMFWMPGEGGNGKTVALTIVADLLGPLGMTTNFHTLADPNNYSLADLAGKRLLYCTESERGQTIAEGLMKNIVSGERIRARQIYKPPIEFRSVSKIFWAVNNLPVIRDTSNAIWRRLHVLPFHREFLASERDVNLLSKLQQELPGILNWAILGLYRLRQNGEFTKAAAAAAKLDELKIETNPVARWLQDRTTQTAVALTSSEVLYSDYKIWAQTNGHHAFNSISFVREIKRQGVKHKRQTKGILYCLTLS